MTVEHTELIPFTPEALERYSQALPMGAPEDGVWGATVAALRAIGLDARVVGTGMNVSILGNWNTFNNSDITLEATVMPAGKMVMLNGRRSESMGDHGTGDAVYLRLRTGQNMTNSYRGFMPAGGGRALAKLYFFLLQDLLADLPPARVAALGTVRQALHSVHKQIQ